MFDTIDHLSNAQTASDVAQTLVAVGAKFDVAYASHRVVQADGLSHGVTTMPNTWRDHYQASGYDRIDPGARRARTFIGYGGDSFSTPKPGEVWSRGMRKMNSEITQLKAGGSLFVAHATPQPGVASMVNFITDATGPGYVRWFNDHAPKLRLVAAAAHARISELSGTAPDSLSLTPRERDALSWLAEGYRVDRIAEKMGLSNRTVEVHLANGRRRLGAKTREQALAIALSAGLLRA